MRKLYINNKSYIVRLYYEAEIYFIPFNCSKQARLSMYINNSLPSFGSSYMFASIKTKTFQ